MEMQGDATWMIANAVYFTFFVKSVCCTDCAQTDPCSDEDEDDDDVLQCSPVFFRYQKAEDEEEEQWGSECLVQSDTFRGTECREMILIEAAAATTTTETFSPMRMASFSAT